YPHAYDFPEDVKAKKVLQMQETNWKHCLESIKQVRPSFYIPSSGPPRFLDPDLAALNDSSNSIFYDFDYMRNDFQSSTNIGLLELSPGDSYTCGKILHGSKSEDRDIESWSKRLTSEWNAFNFDRTDYSEADLEDYFYDIKEKNVEFIKRFPRRFRLVVISSKSRKEYVIALDTSENVICPAPEAGSVNYTFTFPAQLIRRILYHDWNWLDALATMKATVHRDEDYYDQALFQILTFGCQPPTLQILLQRLENDIEMIKKGRFVFQRLCPHAGHDLSYATIEGNVLTCPRHRWQWDLITGRCLRGGNTPIKTRPAEVS
ncbi:MAG: Rieske 2Fe-2S domain-containing protein, partial [Acidobacteria bacterium]|nr:Rieske 2Fe-2S domain-containing protein [Acidobacteriota bacterium]